MTETERLSGRVTETERLSGRVTERLSDRDREAVGVLREEVVIQLPFRRTPTTFEKKEKARDRE